MLYYIATSVKYSQNRYAAEVAVYVHMLLDLSATLIKKQQQETQGSQQYIESGKK